MNNENYNLNLKKLFDAANAACRVAADNKDEINSSVNWGDIGCNEIRVTQNENGNLMYCVVCEEAEPDAEDFIGFVEEELFGAGFAEVKVITEW